MSVTSEHRCCAWASAMRIVLSRSFIAIITSILCSNQGAANIFKYEMIHCNWRNFRHAPIFSKPMLSSICLFNQGWNNRSHCSRQGWATSKSWACCTKLQTLIAGSFPDLASLIPRGWSLYLIRTNFFVELRSKTKGENKNVCYFYRLGIFRHGCDDCHWRGYVAEGISCWRTQL